MYRTCIFCSAHLGANQALEAFPVGRRVAFDGWKGRLWAVCTGCGRWNLAPMEERWEAIEQADRAFRDTRVRVQSENVGLARLPDGTRLIRVGEALPGELAAWRYGDQLVSRRLRYMAMGAALGGAALAAFGGLLAVGAGGALMGSWSIFGHVIEEKQARKVVHRMSAADSPTGTPVTIRRWHLQGSVLAAPSADGIELHVPDVSLKERRTDGWGRPRYQEGELLVLPDAQARLVLGRAMVQVNRKGASRGHVADAVRLLERSEGAEAYLRDAARRNSVLGRRRGMEARQLTSIGALALEMALHDEQERRALEGELGALEAAWRQAEEIAGIADALPDLPPSDPPRLILPG
ncbi:MAG TPA: hypothetical protein VF665_21110 [Longimicrobium sp.]|jgi:hypothetical protein|uniref:hypothetical protein n=1 Tax=Longimicrobium sp. TaxID=2029185 RepID=UPI002ED82D57